MPTLTHVMDYEEVLAEEARISATLLNAGFPADHLDLVDAAVDSLAHDLADRARKLGISVFKVGKVWSNLPEEWEPGDPREAKVFFCFPDDANAVLFKTMFI
ncbi:MAG: hypothetical protein J0H39_00010 [Alphaproteobacteria bacterium]|nr:hypothetical protein [Alphaproteobacteria bacterium]